MLGDSGQMDLRQIRITFYLSCATGDTDLTVTLVEVKALVEVKGEVVGKR
jgi:hypothetical protein